MAKLLYCFALEGYGAMSIDDILKKLQNQRGNVQSPNKDSARKFENIGRDFGWAFVSRPACTPPLHAARTAASLFLGRAPASGHSPLLIVGSSLAAAVKSRRPRRDGERNALPERRADRTSSAGLRLPLPPP